MKIYVTRMFCHCEITSNKEQQIQNYKHCDSMTKTITTTTKFSIPSNSKPRATDCPKINYARAMQNTYFGIFKKL